MPTDGAMFFSFFCFSSYHPISTLRRLRPQHLPVFSEAPLLVSCLYRKVPNPKRKRPRPFEIEKKDFSEEGLGKSSPWLNYNSTLIYPLPIRITYIALMSQAVPITPVCLRMRKTGSRLRTEMADGFGLTTGPLKITHPLIFFFSLSHVVPE